MTIAGDAILTPRLRLRRARIEDLPDLHRVFADPLAMRYWDTPPHTALEQTRGWLARMVDFPSDSTDDFVVEHDGRVIGKAGCWRLAEIGFILHSDRWGRGLGTEVLTAVIPHVFATLAVDTLTAEVDPRNAAALRLLERLGFRETHRQERTICVGDEWCDSVYLALPRPVAA